MKKLSLILISTLSFASTMKYLVHTQHAFPLKKNDKLLILEIQKINNTIDIFHIKKEEMKSSQFNSLGDMTGYNLKFLYGLSNTSTLITNLQKQDIQYGQGNLTNYNFSLSNKFNIINNINNALSIDIGININKGNKVTYSNPKYLIYLANKILDKKISFQKNNYININNKNYKITNSSITLSNMKDISPFIRLVLERDTALAYISLFTSVYYTKINTDIKANINLLNNENSIFYNKNINLDRNEQTLNIGFNLTFKWPIIVEFSYKYRYIFRKKNLGYIKYNHIINLDLEKALSKKTFIYVGGKLMYRQFNGEIPYLYNKYTQTTFDHKYGWAKIGIGYYF